MSTVVLPVRSDLRNASTEIMEEDADVTSGKGGLWVESKMCNDSVCFSF